MSDTIVEESDIFVGDQPDVFEFVSVESDKNGVHVYLTSAGSKWPGPIEAELRTNPHSALCIGNLLIKEAKKAAGIMSKGLSRKNKEAVE